ncbi:hypothetical protein [Psychromonas ossibalaenae]|uniref:hypothetical protein n=1 Tax=Psychromonas ossibalaenae TaxID=444922 RepID=UPI000362CFD2|nr:hypothetical protein [Psychromonas ossibalaenae]
MEALQWFSLGIISMLAINVMVYVHRVIDLKWYTLPLLFGGVVDILVGVAWCWSSFLEGYPQSGAMGLSLFSGSGLVVIIMTWRHLVAPGLNIPMILQDAKSAR